MTTTKLDPDEKRPFSHGGRVAVFGRSYVDIICPFCAEESRAYVWSLAGSGKVCTCGALHTSWGYSRRRQSKHT